MLESDGGVHPSTRTEGGTTVTEDKDELAECCRDAWDASEFPETLLGTPPVRPPGEMNSTGMELRRERWSRVKERLTCEYFP